MNIFRQKNDYFDAFFPAAVGWMRERERVRERFAMNKHASALD